MSTIETLEEYFDNIAPELQPEVRAFLEEYYEKKETHSANAMTFGKLNEEELKNLLYLELGDNKIDNLTQKISTCQNLKILIIDSDLVDFDFLANLSNLRILEICFNNNTQDISSYLDNMGSLLLLSQEEISSINRFPSNLKNIVYLDLSKQNLQEIPDLTQYPFLVSLILSDNQIKEIPTSIKNLKYLNYLSIFGNKIKTLPKEIFELPNLDTLWFNDNQIDNLPEEIFSAQNLKEVWFSNNPYENMPTMKMISDLSVDPDVEAELFQILKVLNKPNLQLDYNYVTLKIPKSLQTPMLQYFEFFKDYVASTRGKDIIFDIKRDKEGLVLITNGNTDIALPQLGIYFEEYVKLTQQKSEDWVFNFEKPTTAMEADILRLKMENEIGRLKNAFQIAKLESQHLSNQLADRNAENQFLKELSKSFSRKIDILISGKTAETLNVDQLLLDILNIAVRMLERKHSQQIENLHNDILTDFLRQKGYQAADQTRSGRSKLGVGEIDIMIRKVDGTPFSIIEAFRLKSCGKNNKTVAEHIDRLVHDYDTAGHERNFVIIYAEAKKFEQLWGNYKNYISEINGKTAFRAQYPLIKFEEKSDISTKSSVKIGLAAHRREGSVVEVYHVFINMFI